MSRFANFVADDIDFAAYLRDSESRARIIPAGRYVDDLWASLATDAQIACQGDPLPWPKFHGQFHLRPRELTAWVGYKGHAKSAVLSEIIASLMMANRKALLISPEFPALELLRRKVRQCAASTSPSEEYVRRWAAWANKRLWLFDKQSKLDPALVLGVVAYGIQSLGVHHIVIDSLMKCGINSDDYNTQKDFVDRLQHLVHQSPDTHVHLVMHARKGADDYAPPNMHDTKGASELIDMAENVITVWMDKRKGIERDQGKPVETNRPDVCLTIEAQRNYPVTGRRFGLFFAKGLRFTGSPDFVPGPYFEVQRESA